jgi:hypothetical protein
MKLSIHKSIGKLPKQECWKLGSNWMNIDASWDDVFALITTDGHATCSELLSDRRDATQFKSRELIMIDVDNDITKSKRLMTFEDLANDELFQEYGAGFYTTPSHNDNDPYPRFRMMFRLARPITDANDMVSLYLGLLNWYTAADTQCLDPTRLFYGTPNAQYKFKTDRTVNDEVVSAFIEVGKTSTPSVKESMYNEEYKDITDADRKKIIDCLRSISPFATRDAWMRIGFGLRAGGFSLADFMYATNEKDLAEATKVWNSTRGSGNHCTMGTVIYTIKSELGDDCLKPAYKQESKLEEVLKQLKESRK